MTFEEASKIILRKHPLSKINGCLDFGNFFVFFLIPFYGKENQSYETGTIFPAIDKKTKKEFKYDLTSDPGAYFKAKKLK